MTTLLEASGLTKRFDGFVAVDHVDLEVEEGSFHSVIGPNGAGKTTLFNLLSGVLPPSGGRIRFAGRDVTGLPAHRLARLGIGRSFQITNLFPNLTALENVRLAVQARSPARWSWFRRAGGLADVTASAREILTRVRLDGRESTPAHALSHGDKRKLEIAVLLGGEPRLLLLDEPTAGMSHEEVPAIMDVIREIRAGGRHTILFVEHKLDLVLNLSDRITVLHHGRKIADGTPAAIAADPTVQAAYIGGARARPA